MLYFGLLGIRAALFPLGFLLFTIPLPDALLSYVITALQSASAGVTDVLFRLSPLVTLTLLALYVDKGFM